MHRRGTEYMNFIKNRYYLDDDFNDHPVHFATAVERHVWLYHKPPTFHQEDYEIYKSEHYFFT